MCPEFCHSCCNIIILANIPYIPPPPADSSPYIAFMLIAFFVRAFEGVCEGKIV